MTTDFWLDCLTFYKFFQSPWTKIGDKFKKFKRMVLDVIFLYSTQSDSPLGTLFQLSIFVHQKCQYCGRMYKTVINFCFALSFYITLPLLICTWFLKNQVGRVFVYFKLDFYCLCRLKKLSLKSSSCTLIFHTWFFKNQVQINRGSVGLWSFNLK